MLDVSANEIWKPGPNFKASTASDCLEQCCDVLNTVQNEKSSMAEFDSLCAPILHRVLRLTPRVAGPSLPTYVTQRASR